MIVSQARPYGLIRLTHRWKAESKLRHVVFIAQTNFKHWRNDLARIAYSFLSFSMTVGADGRAPNQGGAKVEPNQIGESPPF